MIKKYLLLAGLSSLLAFQANGQKLKGKEKKSLERIQSHIEYLASDALQGRGTGTPGELKSAEYIAAVLKEYGVQPKGEDKYFQKFEMTTLRMALGKTTFSAGDTSYTLFEGFYPESSSANKGSFSGALVSVGFGIVAEDLKHNDYKDKSVEGKAVLINLGSPDGIHPHSKYLAYHAAEYRVAEAIKQGAKAVVFYKNSDITPTPESTLSLTNKPSDIPVVFVKDPAIVNKSTVNMSVDIATEKQVGRNVLGYVDHAAPYTVVICAHHDHLGLGSHGNSLDPESNEIHNGADDNASGVAAMLEMAKNISGNSKNYGNYNFLFIAFSGEELGLVGSKYYVKNPVIPNANINYVLNMDMVGKLDSTEKALIINGVGTSPIWSAILNQVELDEERIARVSTTESGLGASDHTPFYLAGVPAIHAFTGQHKFYHKPADDPNIINYKGEVFVINYLLEVCALLNEKGKLDFTKTKEESNGGRMSFKVTLGIIPDYVFDGDGMRVDGVKSEGNGAKAGLKDGDIIVAMGETLIHGIRDYMKVLGQLDEGAESLVKVKRDGKIVELNVKFE